MKKKFLFAIRIIIFFTIGLLLFWLVYKDQPLDQIVAALKEADYFWIGVSLFLSLLSHISRAMRWNLLIEPLGYRPRLFNSFFAVMTMYISNMAIPRSGEIARCSVLKRYEKVPVSQSFGTVVTERIFDMIMLGFLLLIVLFTQMKTVLVFVHNNPEVKNNVQAIFSLQNLIVFVVMLTFFIILLFLFRSKLAENKIFKKIKELFMSFASGLLTVWKMKKKWQFIFHSIFIWVMYFLMIYVVFQSFEFTKHLGIMTGLTVFVMSSLGMVAPSPGGIGTWHFMAIETLILYGVQKYPDANAFAFAAHGAMTLFILILGLISIVLLPIVNRGKSS